MITIALVLPLAVIPTEPTHLNIVWTAPNRAVSMATFAAINALVAFGLGMLLRFVGLASVVHASLWGAGAYTAGRLSVAFDLDVLLLLPAAALVPMLLALAVSRLALRTTGMSFLIITIAMNEFLVLVANNVEALTNGTRGLILTERPHLSVPFGMDSSRARYVLVLTFLYLTVVLVWSIGRSRFGRRLEAIRDNELLARSIGIDALRHKTAIFVISAGVVGVAGLLLIYHQQAVTPSQFGSFPFITIVLMVVVGGTRSLAGPMVGAWIVTFLPQWLGPLGLVDENRQQLVFGMLLILVMLVGPAGITGLARRVPQRPDSPARTPPTVKRSTLVGDPPGVADLLLSVAAVSQSFGALQALDRIDLEIRRHEIVGIMGPNGSGKTTLFNCVSGVLTPSTGDIRFEDRPIVGWQPDQVARLGLVRTFQEPLLFRTFQVRDCLTVADPPTDLSDRRSEVPRDPDELLDFCGLARLAGAPVATLSYGQLRLLGVGIALSADPALLLMDEPAAGLNDVESRALADLLRRVRHAGVTLGVIEHDMSFLLPLCDRVVVLDAGRRIMEGPPGEVARSPTVVASYLGRRFAEHATGGTPA